MSHYLDKDFKAEYLEIPASVRSEEYYVKMMVAWFFATALAKQWDATIPYIEQNRLAPWTHNKTIQKAIESYRITPEQKEYMRTLKKMCIRDSAWMHPSNMNADTIKPLMCILSLFYIHFFPRNGCKM